MAMESQPTDNESSRKKRVRHGSQPPVGLTSDAEVSRWLLEAVREDMRLAEIELAENRRIAAEKFGSNPSTDKQPAPAVHRGCKYRLPSSDPIAIPKIPYDPHYLWFHQQTRLRQAYMTMNAPKQLTNAIRNLVDIVVELGFMSDLELDLYDNDFGEKEDKQCPICSCSPEEVNQEIKIEVVQEIEVSNYQVTAVDQEEIEIGVDAVAMITSTNPATQDTTTAAVGANTTNLKNRIHFCLQR